MLAPVHLLFIPVPHAPLVHFLLETLGIFLAGRYYYQLRRKTVDPISSDHRMTLLITAAFGAFAGSRLLGALEDPTLFWSGGGELGWTYYLLSKTIVGGFLGGLAAVELTKVVLGERNRSGDLLVYPLLVAMITGRWGCFLMGILEPTYGLPTTAWSGLDLGDGILRHPTALYEVAFLALLWLALRQTEQRRPLPNGRRFMLFLTSYLVYRLVVAFWQPGIRTGGLTSIQWACVAGLAWYAWEWKRELAGGLHLAGAVAKGKDT